MSLGSNLGDRLAHLREARQSIAALPDVEILASSPVYETEPVDVPPGFSDMPFLNAILLIHAVLDIGHLHDELMAVESRMGRRRSNERNAPRPMDIDIIYAGTLVLETGRLIVPHPRWADRRFVVQPLADVRPWLKLPAATRTVRETLETLPTHPAVVLFSDNW